eukprot:Sspe_Gene.16206::Locus_5707_Transcript_1_1_Confidence_1.000_Length_1380::g.16206::m.16206
MQTSPVTSTPPTEFIKFVDSKGNEGEINIHEEASSAVLQCCDPYNEHIYSVPVKYIETTAGLTSHMANKTGRRAQICMAFQTKRCNMREKCLQIHADHGLISTLRQHYIADKKTYVSEVQAVDPTDGKNEVLTFKYSEIEHGAAKENYRRLPESHRYATLCQNFLFSNGFCPNGSQCNSIHVAKDKYNKAKAGKTKQVFRLSPSALPQTTGATSSPVSPPLAQPVQVMPVQMCPQIIQPQCIYPQGAYVMQSLVCTNIPNMTPMVVGTSPSTMTGMPLISMGSPVAIPVTLQPQYSIPQPTVQLPQTQMVSVLHTSPSTPVYESRTSTSMSSNRKDSLSSAEEMEKERAKDAETIQNMLQVRE